MAGRLHGPPNAPGREDAFGHSSGSVKAGAMGVQKNRGVEVSGKFCKLVDALIGKDEELEK